MKCGFAYSGCLLHGFAESYSDDWWRDCNKWASLQSRSPPISCIFSCAQCSFLKWRTGCVLPWSLKLLFGSSVLLHSEKLKFISEKQLENEVECLEDEWQHTSLLLHKQTPENGKEQRNSAASVHKHLVQLCDHSCPLMYCAFLLVSSPY